LIAISYTLILTITLIQPSRTPLIGPAAPPGPPDATREAFLTFMQSGWICVTGEQPVVGIRVAQYSATRIVDRAGIRLDP